MPEKIKIRLNLINIPFERKLIAIKLCNINFYRSLSKRQRIGYRVLMKSILTNTNKEEIELIKKLDYDVSQEEENEFRQLCDKLYIAKPYIIQV